MMRAPSGRRQRARGLRRWSGRPAKRALFGVAIACAIALRAVQAAAVDAPIPAAEPPAGARPSDIDQLAARVQQTFAVPGLAIAIVKDGRTVFAKGYGVRAVGEAGKIDDNTLFEIGSNTKAFTTAALAMLVDEGKLGWDDKVIDRLPGFRLYDPYVTREFTVRDLLTHRSGLGLGAGDLMFVPHTNFTRAEIIHNLRYLKPVSSFRSTYAYDNLLYMVAGEIVPAITGQSWEDFVQTRVLDPLATGCAADLAHASGNPNIAAPHVLIMGAPVEIAPETNTALDPAGGIECGVRGMAAWMLLQLDGGRAVGGARLFSQDRHQEMWSPQTVIPSLPPTAAMTATHLRDYGLGWSLEDYEGVERVWHTGGLVGMVSYVSLIPERRLGIVVLANQQSGGAISAVMQDLLDAFLGVPPRDWIAYWSTREKDAAAKDDAAQSGAEARIKEAGGRANLPLGAYVGVYRDPWRGEATVSRAGEGLRLTFSRTAGMQGDLRPYSGDVFVVRWDDRTLKADALVRFRTDFTGAVDGMTMKALSPTTDFSFDFQDLDFTREAGAP